MPSNLPKVLEASLSEKRGICVREATTMSYLAVRCISMGMCLGLFSKSASIVIITGYLACCMPWSRPFVWPSLVLVTATSAKSLAV